MNDPHTRSMRCYIKARTSIRWPPVLAGLLAVGLVLIPPHPAPAEITTDTVAADAVAAIVAKVIPAVVKVVVVVRRKQQPAGPGSNTANANSNEPPTTAIGSGFVIDSRGYIATNKHVVEDGIAAFVQTGDGVRHKATIVGLTSKADMALLKISTDRPLPVVGFGDSDSINVGDTVIAIGNPFGFDNTVTAGIVSAVNRNIMESPFDDYIQTDAPINHGNSGGPLFNLSGQVIGMNSVLFAPGKYSGSAGLGFAIPSNDLRFVMDRLIKDGAVRAGMLPLRTQQLTWMIQQAVAAPGLDGALVDSLQPGGEKMMNGQIKPGDVILSFNGLPITDPRDLARKVARTKPSTDAQLEIFRDGARTMVRVAVQEWPEGKPPTISDGPAPTLGLQLTSGPDNEVVVADVDPTGSVADSGIQKGDIVVQVQQQPVSGPTQALHVLQALSAQKHGFAALLMERDRQRSWIPIALPAS